jgi:aspartate/methionine/tyrosine aminotransferase
LGVCEDDVQIGTGASEALLSLFFLAADGDANVVIPTPGYPAFSAFPQSLGMETRTYAHRSENAFQPDIDEIKSLVDEKTRIVLVNTPHNPTGTVLSADVLRELHDFTAERNIQFVVDEVYHPIYYGKDNDTAAKLPHAIILGDLSKALCMAGLRVGWIVDRNRTRLEQHRNARAYFTISNGVFGEGLAEVAVRNRDKIFKRARATAENNLALLDSFFKEEEEYLLWVRPQGGFTTFPNLASGIDSRAICQRVAELGVLLAPGDCFGYPSHFRLGFGACEEGFANALEVFSEALRKPA